MPRQFRILLNPHYLLLLIAAISLVFLSACASESDEESVENEERVFELPVREIEYRTPVINRTYPGRTEGMRWVEVRAQVSGVLQQRTYSEGDLVERDDVLFHIDPNRYSVEVQQASAELERARAAERQAEREWQLVSGLYEEDAITERERNETLSQLETAQANVALTEAALEARQIDLNYSQVRTPIEGIAGMEERSEGNLIQAGDLLTTVVQMDPIQVPFSIPEDHIRAFGSQIRNATVDVFMTLPDGHQYGMPGRVDFVGSRVDEQTGTVNMRAVFPNPDGEIIPGQFVRLTLSQLLLERVIRVPQRAVVRGRHGPMIYVLDDEDRALQRSVRLGAELEDQVVIVDGLVEGDRVVVDGLGSLSEGQKVDPEPEETEESTEPEQEGDDREQKSTDENNSEGED
ncbi:membrane fusion protein (multidrug efflux system) [Natronospira proteinivora]|uniref:Membrane fusion protein (Multidrug efflux system) n=1 Tax=Natronospira proteinivora TaxID=1807133 RepID=A0ABT1G6G8_9GAMM|nr:efflux RND transporter periplasmic adaptor subunit [Natronospira proteinivora]MCP1726898.1 membrane fusion protein (multidrug efflux system) [Natronospira proteinivora]